MFTLLALIWNGLLFKDGFASLTRARLIRPGTWIRLLCPCYRSATYHNVDSHMSSSQIFISSNEKTKTKLWIWLLCYWCYPDTSHISSTPFGEAAKYSDMIFVKNFTQPDFQAKSFTPQKCVICDIFLAN